MRNVNIIAACDIRGGFAKSGAIPWINEEIGKLDLKNFQKITNGHICIMGTNTYQEIYDMRVARTGGEITELLPGRTCFVITSNPNRTFVGATAVSSLRAVIQTHDFDGMYNNPVFIIGGRRLFIEAIAWAENVYLTVINKDYNCDKFFPLTTINKKFHVAKVDKQDGIAFVHYSRHTHS